MLNCASYLPIRAGEVDGSPHGSVVVPACHYRAEMSHTRENLLFEYRYAKTKGADQLCGNHAADQSLYFPFMDTTIPIVP